MIELSEMIENLRSELSKARDAGMGEGLRFEVDAVELELAVGVSRDAGGSGGVRFWVIELGAEAHASSQTTQRMTLTLRPVLPGGGPALVGGESVPGER